MRKFVPGLGIVAFVLAVASAASAESVIIKCKRPCTAIVQAVEQNGGVVTYRYKYVDAIAADVTTTALGAVRGIAELGARAEGSPDSTAHAWRTTSAERRDGRRLHATSTSPFGEAQIVALASASPNAYTINNAAMNLTPLHGTGTLGQGMKVAVIDSGIRPDFPHLSLDGSVIGGETWCRMLLGFSNSANNGHGTFVAGMISGNVVFTVDGGLRSAVTTHCPTCVFPIDQTLSLLPITGSAPLSSIYALRVFPPTGGAPESRVLAAMERVLQLRENFDNGIAETPNPDGSYSALNITVCNMSLGGPTLFAGQDLESEMTEAFLAKDIVLVVAAGNAGPSGSTVGSPGTGRDALTVGATSSAVHERILRDLQLGLGLGVLFRPFAGVQTAYFSSRGPNADGRHRSGHHGERVRKSWAGLWHDR